MKPVLAAASLCLAWFATLPHSAAAQDPAESRRQIEAIVQAFGKAIIAKDTAGFMRLFLHEDVTWVGVDTDASMARERATLTDPKQVLPKIMCSTPRKFIEHIARTPEARSETFENVRIDTDRDIAQVLFDYSFIRDNYRNNWGKESWQLVRTEDGWKIAAVIWSMEMNPVPPPKK